MYSKANIHPTIESGDMKKITQLYSELRKETLNAGIPITVRHIESIIRVSEAFCKLRLRTTVNKSDIDNAITLVLESFLAAQKYSVAKQLRVKFSKYFQDNTDDLLIFILKTMIKEKLSATGSNVIKREEFFNRCKNSGINAGESFFKSGIFFDEGFSLDGNKIVRNLNE